MNTMNNTTIQLSRLALAAGTAIVLGFTPAAFADETVALKNALYGAGYDITSISSTMDDSTRSELTRFQNDNGLQANGMLDDATRKALGMISVQAVASAPSQEKQTTQSAASGDPEPLKEEPEEEEDDGGWSFF